MKRGFVIVLVGWLALETLSALTAGSVIAMFSPIQAETSSTS